MFKKGEGLVVLSDRSFEISILLTNVNGAMPYLAKELKTG